MFFKHFFKSQDRQFGLLLSLIFIFVFLYRAFQLKIFGVFFSLAPLVLITLTIFFPKIFYFPSKLWIKFGFLLGLIVTPLMLTLIYALTIVPINLLLRILNIDILKMKKTNQPSYWISRDQKSTNFKDQF